MYAPKPAISGNGHAAMQKTQPAVIYSNTAEKASQNKEQKKDSKIKNK